jgi:hypothetical protein
MPISSGWPPLFSFREWPPLDGSKRLRCLGFAAHDKRVAPRSIRMKKECAKTKCLGNNDLHLRPSASITQEEEGRHTQKAWLNFKR